jgi:hypothetical protein
VLVAGGTCAITRDAVLNRGLEVAAHSRVRRKASKNIRKVRIV